MKFEKGSKILFALMLAIFVLIVTLGMISGLYDLSHKSYICAFAVAALLFLAVLKWGDRVPVITNKIVLSLICFVVNGLWIVLFSIEPEGDFTVFWGYAQLLSYRTAAVQHYVALFPHIFGYSWFLSWFVGLFGASLWVPEILNLLLTVGSGLIIYTIVNDRLDERKAGIAYLLWILCPSKMIFNSMVLSEPYYTNLILLFILVVERLDKKNTFGWLFGILAGLLLVLTDSARPVAVIPLIAFFIWLLLLGGYKKCFIPFSVTMLLVYIIFGNLWDSYMKVKLQEEPASGIPGYNVYVGLNPETDGRYSNDDIDELFALYYDDGLSAPEAQKIMLGRALDRLKSGEINIAELAFKKLGFLFGNDEAGAFYAVSALSLVLYSVLCIVSNVFYYLLILFALRSAIIGIWKPEPSVLCLAPLYVIGLVLAQLAVEVAGRYHYSILPMLIIMAVMFNSKEGIKNWSVG